MTAFRPVKMPRHKPAGKASSYQVIWRIVDGAVRDTMLTHPDYFPNRKRLALIRSSLNKRIAGALIGFAEQSAKGGMASDMGQILSMQSGSPGVVVTKPRVESAGDDAGREERHLPATTPEAT